MPNPNVFAPGMPQGYTIPDKPKDWFSYPISFAALLNGVPQTTNIAIDAGSDFFLTAITYLADVTATTAALTSATRYVPQIKMLLTDSGSNRQLMQNPVDIDQIGGNGEWPHRLIHPRLFLRNSNIQVAMTSYDATNSWAITINFEGFRIYS